MSCQLSDVFIVRTTAGRRAPLRPEQPPGQSETTLRRTPGNCRPSRAARKLPRRHLLVWTRAIFLSGEKISCPCDLSAHARAKPAPADQSRIYFVPQPLDADLQAVVDDEAPEQRRFNEVTSLFLWGHKAFKYEPDAGGQWQEKLKAAKEMGAEPASTHERWTIDAPVFVAAVCVRDHWSELNSENRDWCLNQLVGAVRRDEDTTDLAVQMSAHSLEGPGFAASALPLVLNFDIVETTTLRVIDALAVALTHSDNKVPLQAAAGIGRDLGSAKAELTHGLIRLIVIDGIREEELYAVERKKPYIERRQHEEIRRQVRQELRAGDFWKTACTAAELSALDLHAWSGRRAYKSLMPLLTNCLGSRWRSKASKRFRQCLRKRGRTGKTGGSAAITTSKVIARRTSLVSC